MSHLHATFHALEYDDDDYVIHYTIKVGGKVVWSRWGYVDEEDVIADVAEAKRKYGIVE